jgi:hypothetical protein
MTAIQFWKSFVSTDEALNTVGVEPWPVTLRDLAIVFVFNTIIALLFTSVLRHGFWRSFVYSQCIGLSIFVCTKIAMRLRRVTKPTGAVAAVAVPLGSALGIGIAYVLVPKLFGDAASSTLLPGSVVGAAVFGFAVSYYFYSRREIAEARAALRERELRRLESEKRASEAELRALQAQIEPHFLFNTLSNVASLIESDPATAKKMLLNFTGYLRGTLDRSRAQRTTLGQEMELVRRYLEIMAIRLGPRLRWRVEGEPSLAEVALPALALQPFVENAIRHGLEPLPEGGEISVIAKREAGDVVIEVTDTGVGWSGTAAPGVGVDNVRQRLTARFGERADVTVHPVAPRGVRVRVRIPEERA